MTCSYCGSQAINHHLHGRDGSNENLCDVCYWREKADVKSLTKSTPYSTVPLPDGIVIGGPWPNTIVVWPGGKSRGATKPEYDLFQALEAAHAEIERLRAQTTNNSQLLESHGSEAWDEYKSSTNSNPLNYKVGDHERSYFIEGWMKCLKWNQSQPNQP